MVIVQIPCEGDSGSPGVLFRMCLLVWECGLCMVSSNCSLQQPSCTKIWGFDSWQVALFVLIWSWIDARASCYLLGRAWKWSIQECSQCLGTMFNGSVESRQVTHNVDFRSVELSSLKTTSFLDSELCVLSWVAIPLSLARIVSSLNYNYSGTIFLSSHFHLQSSAGSDDKLWGYPVYKLNESYL